MISATDNAHSHELLFGAFRLLPKLGLLYRADNLVRLGCREREILLALVERAGEIVRKKDLVTRVWPDTVVEEGTLRVHIAGLRKALNDGREGARFVENVTGLGYRFVAHVSLSRDFRPVTPGSRLSGEGLLELQRLREENERLRRVVVDLTQVWKNQPLQSADFRREQTCL